MDGIPNPYEKFRVFEDLIREAANRVAVTGIENSLIYITACATILVSYMGFVIFRTGGNVDRLGSFAGKIAVVIFLVLENGYLNLVAPAILDDLPNVIGAAAGGTGMDVFVQFGKMESLIDAICARSVEGIGFWKLLPVIPAIYFAGDVCKIFVAFMFVVVMFFRLSLFIVVAYGAWLLLFLLFDTTRSYALGALGQAVSILCGMIGVQIVFAALTVALDNYGQEMIAAIPAMSMQQAIAATGSLAGAFFTSAVMLLASGWIAARIGGSAVPAAGASMAAAAAGRMANAAAAMEKAANALRQGAARSQQGAQQGGGWKNGGRGVQT